jgi:hypothetical protein
MMATKDSGDFLEDEPDSVVAEAKAAFGRRAQGDLAVLVYDSLVDDNDPAADHRLRFEHARLLIEVQVSAVGGGSSVTARVSPPTPVRVELEAARKEGTTSACIDHGVFAFHDVPHGTVRILLPPTGDDPPMHSDWFRI